MSEQQAVIQILEQALSLPDTAAELTPDQELMGAVAEFDSMAVVNILTSLENYYGFVIDDDEIDADVFSTVASLIAFVEQKIVSGM